jgi:hypothetical protein
MPRAVFLKSGEGLVVEAVSSLNRFGRSVRLRIAATGARSCHMDLYYNKCIGMQDTKLMLYGQSQLIGRQEQLISHGGGLLAERI